MNGLIKLKVSAMLIRKYWKRVGNMARRVKKIRPSVPQLKIHQAGTDKGRINFVCYLNLNENYEKWYSV